MTWRRLFTLSSVVAFVIVVAFIAYDLIVGSPYRAELNRTKHGLTAYFTAKSLVLELPDILYFSSEEDFQSKRQRYFSRMTSDFWLNYFSSYQEGTYYPLAVKRIVGQPSPSGDFVFKVDLVQRTPTVDRQFTTLIIFEEGRIANLYKVF